MNNHKEHIGDDMLALYLTGELGESDSLIVETWISENTQNHEYFKDFEKTWKLTAKAYPKQKVDTDLAWKLVESKMIQDELTTESSSGKKRFNIYKIAAVLIIPIAIYSWLTLFNQPKETQIVATTEETKSHTLTDGTQVSLNTGSEVSFTKDFNAATRTIALKGEAFFDVKRDESKPFIIKAPIGSVQVLGTSFNVEARANEDMTVRVESGLVKLFTIKNQDTVFTFLRAGEGGIIKQNSHEIILLSEARPDALFWLNKKLNFKATPLDQVFETLKTHYGIDFIFDESLVQNCKLTAEFENDNIETILDVISATFNFKLEPNNLKQFKVSGNEMDCLDAEI